MIICTTATLSHVPYALELARSVRTYLPGAKFVLGLVEERVPHAVAQSPWIDEVILARELPIPDFTTFIFRLTNTMSRNIVKAQLMKRLLESDEQADIVIYADCYLRFFGHIPELLQLLIHHPIVLTPHLIDTNYTDSYERELLLLNDGTYHSGLVAVNRSDEARSFVTWWADKLNGDERDPYGSDFFDQKWLNFAPIYYNVGLLKHPGYQVGFWNFHEPSREAAVFHENGGQLAGGPLRCMNFSNENNAFLHYVDQLSSQQSHAYRHMREHYEASVRANDQYGYLNHALWSYDYYTSGERIAQEARIHYRNWKPEDRDSNPFEGSNGRYIRSAEASDAG